MYCSKCGKQIPDHASFCMGCGTKVSADGKTKINNDFAKRQKEKLTSVSEINLKKSIDILYNMEQEIYFTTCVINSLESKKNDLCKRYKIKEPERKIATEPKNEYIGCIAFIVGLVGFIVGMAIAASSAESNHGLSLDSIVSSFFSVAGGGIIGLIIGLVIVFCLNGIIKGAKTVDEQDSLDEEYETACMEYNQVCEEQEERIECEKREFFSIENIIKQLNKKNAETKRQLTKYYDIVGIDKDYRSLVPIGYMKDYIRLNISTHLEGVDGLNYLIRQEIRWDLLQMTVEEIYNKLDELIEINKYIFSSLSELNNKCDKLVASVDNVAREVSRSNRVLQEIQQVESLNAYYNERAAKELEYRNTMDTIYGRWS